MKHKKLLGRARNLEAEIRLLRQPVHRQLAPAVDKKLNPTGYSESDDEDLPF